MSPRSSRRARRRELRTLDAIHLACALALAGVLTYDRRMADAARALGLAAIAPGGDPLS
jgi:hypothetical protein